MGFFFSFLLFSLGEMEWYNWQVLLKLLGTSTKGLCRSLKDGQLGFFWWDFGTQAIWTLFFTFLDFCLFVLF